MAKSSKRKVEMLFIFCEGESEEKYFKEAKRSFRKSSSSIEIVCLNGIQEQFVEKAWEKYEQKANIYRALKGQVHIDDIAYCVLDVDNKTSSDLLKLQSDARKYNMTLIESNPSFELWIKLHFVDHPITLKDDQKKIEKEVKAIFKNNRKAYKKAEKGLFEAVIPQLDNAVTRAKDMRKSHQLACNSPIERPSTKIDLIIERYRK